MNNRFESKAKVPTDNQLVFASEIKVAILPVLKMLKETVTDNLQALRLVTILEIHLKQLAKSYGHISSLNHIYQQLTPVESQVVALISQGLSSQEIAGILKISSGTVSIHRKHIRKKLGLDNKSTNLQSYLQSLAE